VESSTDKAYNNSGNHSFGMVMPGHWFNSSEYRYGYNGKERTDEISPEGSGDDYDYGARMYDSRLGRWLSVDPIAIKTPWASPYNGFSNDPIDRIDPSGKGDFYSQAGTKLGSDGNNDGKIYVVKDVDCVMETIQKNTANNVYTKVSDVQANVVQLPSAYVRKEIAGAVDRSNSATNESQFPGDADADKKVDNQGGFHEEGGVFGETANKSELVVPAKPGAYEDPSKSTGAAVSVFDSSNPDDFAKLTSMEGSYHIHPSGSITVPSADGKSATIYGFGQPPSRADLRNAKTRAGSIHIVIGAGDKTVYLYDKNGLQATFPLALFKSLGNEPQKKPAETKKPAKKDEKK
jgi:RHS repeat-associated protein